MGKWSNLTAQQKAAVIKFAIDNGVSDINSIRDTYNLYSKGIENELAEGGSIHIKPSKRGTFTAAAKKHGKSVQAFASQVLAHKENYSPAMVKKAVFAHNSKSWKHADGGSTWLPEFTLPKTPSERISSFQAQQPIRQVIQQGAQIRQQQSQQAIKNLQEQDYLRQHGLVEENPGLIPVSIGADLSPIGDIEQIGEAIQDAKYGNYNQAAFGLGLLFLPNFLAKGIKAQRAAKTFTSELNWNPDDWFSLRPGNVKGTKEEGQALLKHLQEYLAIEEASKNNGTWLKMFDGSTWEGDPRTWVQLHSNSAKPWNINEVISSGMDTKKASNIIYNGDVWGVPFGKGTMAKDWAGLNGEIVSFIYPNDLRVFNWDAKNHFWNNLPPMQNNIRIPWTDGWNSVLSEGVVDFAKPNYDITKIDNVIEGFGEKTKDIIIHEGVPRKAVLGGTGDFNPTDLNWYHSTGGPLYPFSFDKQIPEVRHANGGMLGQQVPGRRLFVNGGNTESDSAELEFIPSDTIQNKQVWLNPGTRFQKQRPGTVKVQEIKDTLDSFGNDIQYVWDNPTEKLSYTAYQRNQNYRAPALPVLKVGPQALAVEPIKTPEIKVNIPKPNIFLPQSTSMAFTKTLTKSGLSKGDWRSTGTFYNPAYGYETFKLNNSPYYGIKYYSIPGAVNAGQGTTSVLDSTVLGIPIQELNERIFNYRTNNGGWNSFNQVD